MTPYASRSAAPRPNIEPPPGTLARYCDENGRGHGRDETADRQVTRLLIPITANPASRRAISYALAQQAAGEAVEVLLLNIGEPIDQWQVLRSWTRRQVDAFQQASAQAFIDDASAPLLQQDITCRGFFRQGPIVQTILDFADENDCTAIVVPAPATGWRRLVTHGIVEVLLKRARDLPIIAVDEAGRAHPARNI